MIKYIKSARRLVLDPSLRRQQAQMRLLAQRDEMLQRCEDREQSEYERKMIILERVSRILWIILLTAFVVGQLFFK